MQTCKKCGIEKPLDEFHKSKNTKSGFCSTCKICAIARAKKWHFENKERHKESAKLYREKNKEHLSNVAKQFAKNNPEKIKQYKAKWKRNNPDIVRRHSREFYHRNLESVKTRKKIYSSNNKEKINAYNRKRRQKNDVKINVNIGNQLRQTMKGLKKGERWFDILGYNIDDLMARLQSMFLDGMSFDNYGEWHIDHIRPISSFDFSNDPFKTAKKCWALSNLQPLWATENLKKGAKWQLP